MPAATRHITFFLTQPALRKWLAANHTSASEVWIGFYKARSSRGGITYAQALDEALCFGWIDAVRKTIDDVRWAIRFTPRKPKSKWSQVNIRRVEELSRLGRMRPAGVKAFEERGRTEPAYSYENTRALDPPYERTLRGNKKAWTFFQAQPPSYRRVASWWVMSAKREETRQKRLATLIGDCEQGRRIAAVTRPERAT